MGFVSGKMAQQTSSSSARKVFGWHSPAKMQDCPDGLTSRSPKGGMVLLQ
jgi:hypothetical protein